MSTATFCGPLRRVDVEQPICRLSCRDMAHGFHDLERRDWFEAQRGAHGCLDAPDWLPLGGVRSFDNANYTFVSSSARRA